MLRFRWLYLAVYGSALFGCSDTPTPLAPTPLPLRPGAPVLSWDGDYPYLTDLPPDALEPHIYSTGAGVRWDGAVAAMYAWMSYFGNSGLINYSLSISGPYPGDQSGTAASGEGGFPGDRTIENYDLRYTAAGTCGHAANLTTSNTASIVGWTITIYGKELGWSGSVYRPDGGSGLQPACPPPPPDDDDGCTPGTVDWQTGETCPDPRTGGGGGEGGGGGQCPAGSVAVVEYVCIDVWDPERGWVEWSCGYATVCS